MQRSRSTSCKNSDQRSLMQGCLSRAVRASKMMASPDFIKLYVRGISGINFNFSSYAVSFEKTYSFRQSQEVCDRDRSRHVNRGPVVGAPMAPGVPLVATFATMANAIAPVGIGIGGNTTTFQDATD